MATHTQSIAPATRIQLDTGSSISVDTINVSKELPKDLFSKYIPRRFSITYADIDDSTYEWILPYLLDDAFIMHLNVFVDGALVEKVSLSSIDDNLEQYSLGNDLTSIKFSAALYNALNAQSEILIVYTPA
jgi:hypothetical protein